MTKDIILFVAGILVGGMNGIAGGGMLLGFPILLALGMPALVANVTTNIIILPGQLSSAYGYRKYLRKVPPVYLLLLLPCAAGAAVGALILRHTASGSFERLVPALVLFAVVLFAFQPFLYAQLHRHMQRRHKDTRTLVLLGAALFPLAAYGGYFGAGFGFIMLAFLGFTSLHDIHKMNAVKNVAAVVIATMDIVFLLSTHLINWRWGLVMAAGNFIGGYSGAVLSQRVPSHAVRLLVIGIGLITAVYLVLRSY